MGDNIFLYDHEALAGVESMNRVNKPAREMAAVDVVNAIMLLVGMESKRYSKAVKQAWERKGILTDYGKGICHRCFEAVEVHDVHKCNVRHCGGGATNKVIIPNTPDEHGSRFGKCSCGVWKTKTIPCVHIFAVTKSSAIQGLTKVNIMLSWLYTSVWREQFGEGTVFQAGFDIKNLKETYQPNPKLRYCPKMAAAAKTGRKKKLKHHKSPLEKGNKRKKKVTKTELTELEEMELGEDMKMGAAV